MRARRRPSRATSSSSTSSRSRSAAGATATPCAQKIKLNFAGRLQVILRESILSADRAQNLVVVKMMPGLGPAAGSAFDGMEIPAIVGTVSGDDTVLVVLRDEQSAAEFCTELTAMIK